MVERIKRNPNQLAERLVRNENVFCSLLFDRTNETLRIVDFRAGNIQTKADFIEKRVLAESYRKSFTLIERDDMSGWQRSGYVKEGTIPGYYKRSDAYFMGRIHDDNFDHAAANEDTPERKQYFVLLEELAAKMGEPKNTNIKTEPTTAEDALEILTKEQAKLAKKGKKPAKKKAAEELVLPIFNQFSREIEHHYHLSHNKKTKQLNIFAAEYQDCFGNAKLNLFFTPKTKADWAVAYWGLSNFIDWLVAIGAVSVFSLVQADNKEMNALFCALDFKNTGWINRQVLTDKGPVDQILWTKKLLI